ncbi:MAG: DUF5658 family protein [Planctomycetota bacterium]
MDDKPGYVDLYHPALFFVLLSVIILSLADAYLTLDAMTAGFRELNPVMNAALGLGKQSFVAIKMLITGLGITLLCMHKTFPRVKLIIFIVVIGYVILIGYHFYLMQFR